MSSIGQPVMEWKHVELSTKFPNQESRLAVYRNGRIFCIGGRQMKKSAIYALRVGSEKKFDMVAVQSTTPPPVVEEHALCLVDKYIYCFGGAWDGVLTPDLLSFNTDTYDFAKIATVGEAPEPMDGHSLVHHKDFMYVFGGHVESRKYCDTFYQLELKTLMWKRITAANPPTPRILHSAAVLQDKLYVFGGKASGKCLNDMCVYDFKAAQWSSPNITGTPPAARWGQSMCASGTLMFIHGGWNGSKCFGDLHCFDAATNTWTEIHSSGVVPSPRTSHIMNIIDARADTKKLKDKQPDGKEPVISMLFFGGRNDSSLMTDVYEMDVTALVLRDEIAEKAATVKAAAEKAAALKAAADKLKLQPVAPAAPKPDEASAKTKALEDAAKLQTGRAKKGGKSSDYTMKATLGTGSFGRVRLCQELSTQRYMAIKILKKKVIIKLKQTEHMMNEKAILDVIEHPFLVNMTASFQDKSKLYLVMEYVAGGEFFTYLRRKGRFDNKTARFYAAGVVSMFEYLHSKNVVYRDLKPENLLVCKRGHLKLTDFGFAKIVTDRTYTLCGTPEYIAPEILLRKGHGKPVDWWALGILIYEMIAGIPPFCDENPLKIYQKILASKLSFPKYFDKDVKDLIKQLLTADISKRIGNMEREAKDILDHAWFAGLNWKDLVEYKMSSPWLPPVKGDSDTANFDSYPESPGVEDVFADGGTPQDPFIGF
jgi:hypothetical protein